MAATAVAPAVEPVAVVVVVVVVVMVVVVVVVVAGKDSCSQATVLPIGAPCPGAWIFRPELISRARGDGVTVGSGGSGGGGGSVGKGSWSLARAVVCVVMGAIGKVFPIQNFFLGDSFSSRCHHTTLVLFPVSFVFTYCFKIVFKMPICVNTICDVLDRSGGLRLALIGS